MYACGGTTNANPTTAVGKTRSRQFLYEPEHIGFIRRSMLEAGIEPGAEVSYTVMENRSKDAAIQRQITTILEHLYLPDRARMSS